MGMGLTIDEIRQRISEALNLAPDAWDGLGPDAPLFGEGLGLDSIDALELVVMLERHYGIRITNIEEGRAALSSLSSLAEYIGRHTEASDDTEAGDDG